MSAQRIYPDKLEIQPLDRPVNATIRVPGSKSITNRALVLAALACRKGPCKIKGGLEAEDTEIMITALRQLGVDARTEKDNGCPPVVIQSNGLKGGKVAIRGGQSSQFLSGLLMASSLAQSDVEVEVIETLVSSPYVIMTTNMMHAFGI